MTETKALDEMPRQSGSAPESLEPPSSEPEPPGPADLSDQLRDVHAKLSRLSPERDPVTQRFTGPNLAAGKTLERSAAFWSAVEPAKRELSERVSTDLAADAATVETLRGLIDAYSEVRLFRTSMFLRLVELGGPITAKGKCRALYRAYLDALDRETKLAQTLGLERRAKPAEGIRQWAERALETER